VHRKGGAVLALAGDDAADADDVALAGGAVAREVAVVARAIRMRHQDADVLADGFLHRVAELPLGRAAEELHDAAAIDDDHGVGNGVEDRAEMALAGPQRLFELLLLVDRDRDSADVPGPPLLSLTSCRGRVSSGCGRARHGCVLKVVVGAVAMQWVTAPRALPSRGSSRDRNSAQSSGGSSDRSNSLRVFPDQTSSRVARSRSQVPTPAPSMPSCRCSSRKWLWLSRDGGSLLLTLCLPSGPLHRTPSQRMCGEIIIIRGRMVLKRELIGSRKRTGVPGRSAKILISERDSL